MNIKIMSDSTCDLPAALVREYNITILPLTIIKGGQEYLDGVTITPEDIFCHVASGGNLCTTAAVNIGAYQEAFSKYAAEYDGVIHITLGANFSSCYQNACIAAADFDNVRVIDSQNLTSGQGHVVLEACRLAKSCTDLDDIAAKLRAFTQKIESSFLLDRLDYMVKGGRCSAVAALGANLLNLKPCIEVKDGKMTVVKKYRGSYAKCAVAYAKDRVFEREDLCKSEAFLANAGVSEDVLSEVRQTLLAYGKFDLLRESKAGCTISCHCGPGTTGILLIRK